ncbi:MAG: MotA/TolQ/ExbB proton channel family protein [Pseudomonadota bacterium]
MPGVFLMFFDPLSLLLVIATSAMIALVQNGAAAIYHAIHIVPRLWAGNTGNQAERARLALLRVEQKVTENGPWHADRIIADIPFVATLAEMLANAPDRASFAEAVSRHRTQLQRRHDAAIGFWSDIAEAAPAIGMIGTVVGLIWMFDGIESADAIGEAMAICLLTSLYGLLLAHVVAGPIARRAELYAAQQNMWHDDVTARFLQLAERYLGQRGVVLDLSNHNASAKKNGLDRAPDIAKAPKSAG